MKKQVTRLLLIIMLAVLFVPLFSNIALAINPPNQTQLDNLEYYKTTEFYKAMEYWLTIWNGSIFLHYSSNQPITSDGTYLYLEVGSLFNGFNTGGAAFNDDTVTTGSSKIGNNNFTINDIEVVECNHNIEYVYSIAPEINSRPVLDLPFYIMYSDPDFNFINLQSYENLPFFTFGEYQDINNQEYDLSWYGYGNMKRYIYQNNEWYLSETKSEGQSWSDTGVDRKKILEVNHSILDYTGETSLEPINYHTGEAPKMMGGSFDSEGYGAKFTMPRNGFRDNSFIFVYNVWYRIPYEDVEGNLYVPDTAIIGFGGDIKEGTRQIEYHHTDVKTINEKKVLEGNVKISVGHDAGLNEVTFQIKRNNSEKVWSASLQTERLTGFVDEDGDGLDDRTGREDNNIENPWYYDDYNPDGNRPDRSQYGDDIIGTVSYYFDTLLYWLLSPFRLIAEGLQSLLTIVTDTFSWAGNFANMIGGLFSFLPSEITGMITLTFTSLIVFTIIKVVRK